MGSLPTGAPNGANFWDGLSSPLKNIMSLCCGVWDNFIVNKKYVLWNMVSAQQPSSQVHDWTVRIVTECRILYSVDVVMYMYCLKILNEYWKVTMAIFRFFKMAAATMLDFWNYKVLTVGRIISAELRHHAKLHGDWYQIAWLLSQYLDFGFFKMVKATILDF